MSYPGNVRELRNLLERSALLCDGDTLEASHVTQALQSGRRSGNAGTAPVGGGIARRLEISGYFSAPANGPAAHGQSRRIGGPTGHQRALLVPQA